MKRPFNRRNVRSFKNESIEDPRELLLSLVDLGSLDAEDVLLACIQEMSDAECKRVLGSLSLPNCCSDVEDEESDEDLLALDDEFVDDTMDGIDEEDIEADVEDETQAEDEEDVDIEESLKRRLEAKIRRLERMADSKLKRRIK